MRGKFRPRHHAGPAVRVPSMRPAHYAREVTGWHPSAQQQGLAFNEARALCAGSFPGDIDWKAVHLVLQ